GGPSLARFAHRDLRAGRLSSVPRRERRGQAGKPLRALYPVTYDLSLGMRYFKLTIAYDVTDFHGWQAQSNKPTIQGEVIGVLERLTQERIALHGAGRTDAGVHALGQVGSFRTQ